MDRQIVYPGAIPLETDLLNTNKYTMIGLAKLASAIMGTSTYVRGLVCSPNSPPSMLISVSAGEIYSLQNVDGTAYSSLPADTTHSILKQGVVLDSTSFTLTAPGTSGYSINYLIQATYTDTDSGSTVLPYYNASNPSVAWSGPNNSGTAQNTLRSGICTLSLKAGVAATTGTQVTPSPDAGYIGLYVVTVAQGATTVTAGNISTYANAPFLPSAGIVEGIQRNLMRYGVDTGSANAYVVNINPGMSSLTAGMEVWFRAANANTAASTLNVSALGAFPVLNQYGATLTAGEIAAGSLVRVVWSAAATSWFVLESTGAIPTVPTASAATNNTQTASTAFVQNAILAASGRLLNIQILTNSGTYVPTSGTKKIVVEATGAGGGAGGASAGGRSGDNYIYSVGGGGGAGAYAKFTMDSGFSSLTYSCGKGGLGGNKTGAPNSQGSSGGQTTFGTVLTLQGGGGGTSGTTNDGFSVGCAAGGGFGANTVNLSGSAKSVLGFGGSVGTPGYMISANGGNAGVGANSFLGYGGFGASNGPGGEARGFGSGGGGALTIQSNTSSQAGGNGGDGLIIVWEYA